jgi:hypothetical protein
MKRTVVLVGLALLGACAPAAPAPPGRSLPPQAIQPAPARYDTPDALCDAQALVPAAPPATAPTPAAPRPTPISWARTARDPRARWILPAAGRCSTCAVTMDFNPRRLNIIYDQNSGAITQVKCG